MPSDKQIEVVLTFNHRLKLYELSQLTNALTLKPLKTVRHLGDLFTQEEAQAIIDLPKTDVIIKSA